MHAGAPAAGKAATTGDARGGRAAAREIVLVALILALSLGLRVYRLPSAPPGLQHDEAFNAHDAEQVLRGAHPVFFTANYGREAFFIYLMAGSIALLGCNPLSIRLPGVACGLAGQVLLYLLLRKLYGRRVALVALVLSTVSFWHLFDSRLGLRAISLPMMLTLTLYLLWLGLVEERRLWWLLSGVAMGLTLYTYLAARLAPLVPLLFLAYLALVERARLRRQWASLVLWAAAALAVFAPFGAFMLRYPAATNARINELSYTVGQLRQGNVGPILRSTVATLGMFTFVGDPEWRYSLPGLPVFGPLAGAFFYLGLYCCLRRWREARGALLLIWLAVMLLPSMLSDSAPSSLRAVGALPAAMALPAIGLVWALDALRERWPQVPRQALWAVVALLLVGGGARTVHSYSAVWAQAPESRWIYEADMAATAAYLNTLPAGSHVCLSSDFSFDLDRYVLHPQLSRPQEIKWFDGRQAFLLPAIPEDGGDVFYVFTASAPLPTQVAERFFADVEPVHQPLDPAGEPAITVYRIGSDTLQRWQSLPPSQPLSVRLGGDIDLVGYELPEEVRQGEAVRAIVYWRPVQRFGRDYGDAPGFFAHLRDGAGNFWAQGDRIGYPAWDWEPGDLVLNWFDLATGADSALQPYWVHLGLSASGRRLPAQDGQGRVLGDEVRLEQPTRLLAAATVPQVEALPIRTRTTCAFGDEIALRGYTLPDEAQSGQEVPVVLFWQALDQPSGDYGVRLRLVDDGGRVRHEQRDPLWPDVYPTSRWPAGGLVRSYHALSLPAELDPAAMALEIDLVDGRGQPLGGAPAVAGLLVKGRQRLFEAPSEMQRPLQAELGTDILLLGYSLEPQGVPRGGVLHLTLYWQARGHVGNSYTVFTHVLAPGNVISGQKDSVPGGGEAPTTSWLPGEVVVDRYDIPIGSDAPLGRQVVEVGMYLPETGERLPASSGGQADPDRRVILGEIEVQGR